MRSESGTRYIPPGKDGCLSRSVGCKDIYARCAMEHQDQPRAVEQRYSGACSTHCADEDQENSTGYYSDNESKRSLAVIGRSTWNERAVFFFTSLGFTTGLHGVCLFPILCELHGGLAFVLCTALMYLVLGTPMVLLETGLGQLGRLSPAALYPKISPLLAGLGVSMCWSSMVVSVSEACLLSWSVVYFYKSAGCSLPWSHQRNNSDLPSTEQYFTGEILNLSSESGMFGGVQQPLVLGLTVTWGIVMFSLAASIRNTGKLCYITTPFTFLVAAILLICGTVQWTDDVTAAVMPRWGRLADPSVWVTAGCYVFHSLNLGLGGLTTIASHNKTTTNLLRDVGLVSVLHFSWGVAMWLIYECLKGGYSPAGTPPGEPWVLFVVLARGFANLRHGVIFAMLAYTMVFMAGLSTLLGTILTIVSSLLDVFPRLRTNRSLVTAAVCSFLFIAGLPLTSQSGLHYYLLLTHYSVSWPLLLHALCTSLVVIYCYGHQRFIAHLASPTQARLQDSVICHMTVLFTSVVPVLLMVLLTSSLYHLGISTNASSYPEGARLCANLLAALPILCLPFGALYKFLQFTRRQNLLQSLARLVKPEEKWAAQVLKGSSSEHQEKTTMTMPIFITENRDFYHQVFGNGNNNLSYYTNRNFHMTLQHHSLNF
uniref:Uncharacterized protein n=1 Tax=Timema monikensis TaxID=170555 RepID=A0A7R9ECT3_9NEOP|nr:unnamed protein product [Timema monikensis]